MAKKTKLKKRKRRGRPPKSAAPVARSIILGDDEWALLEKKAGIGSHASWATKLRALLGIIEKRK